MLKLPNLEYPEYPIVTEERRVGFRALYDAVYAEARADGCIWIPFDETSPKKKPSYAEAAEMAEENTREKKKQQRSAV